MMLQLNILYCIPILKSQFTKAESSITSWRHFLIMTCENAAEAKRSQAWSTLFVTLSMEKCQRFFIGIFLIEHSTDLLLSSLS